MEHYKAKKLFSYIKVDKEVLTVGDTEIEIENFFTAIRIF